MYTYDEGKGEIIVSDKEAESIIITEDNPLYDYLRQIILRQRQVDNLRMNLNEVPTESRRTAGAKRRTSEYLSTELAHMIEELVKTYEPSSDDSYKIVPLLKEDFINSIRTESSFHTLTQKVDEYTESFASSNAYEIARSTESVQGVLNIIHQENERRQDTFRYSRVFLMGLNEETKASEKLEKLGIDLKNPYYPYFIHLASSRECVVNMYKMIDDIKKYGHNPKYGELPEGSILHYLDKIYSQITTSFDERYQYYNTMRSMHLADDEHNPMLWGENGARFIDGTAKFDEHTKKVLDDLRDKLQMDLRHVNYPALRISGDTRPLFINERNVLKGLQDVSSRKSEILSINSKAIQETYDKNGIEDNQLTSKRHFTLSEKTKQKIKGTVKKLAIGAAVVGGTLILANGMSRVIPGMDIETSTGQYIDDVMHIETNITLGSLDEVENLTISNLIQGEENNLSENDIINEEETPEFSYGERIVEQMSEKAIKLTADGVRAGRNILWGNVPNQSRDFKEPIEDVDSKTDKELAIEYYNLCHYYEDRKDIGVFGYYIGAVNQKYAEAVMEERMGGPVTTYYKSEGTVNRVTYQQVKGNKKENFTRGKSNLSDYITDVATIENFSGAHDTKSRAKVVWHRLNDDIATADAMHGLLEKQESILNEYIEKTQVRITSRTNDVGER